MNVAKITLVIGGIVLGILSMALAIFYLIDNNIVCPRFGRSVELESKYDFFNGCFLNYEGQWIPAENLMAGRFMLLTPYTLIED